jgi:hypothetical protein
MGLLHNWTEEETNFLKTWYPHFGSYYVADKLGIPRPVVKCRVDKLELHLLPKTERKCISCESGRQDKRSHGYYCSECFNIRRKMLRRKAGISMEQRFNELLRSARKRSKVTCDLTLDYLLDLWQKQDGRCFYSGIPMEFARWGCGRKAYSVSLDQKVASGGYTKDNVVLCCWAVNSGKNDLPLIEYIDICKKVTEHWSEYSKE